MRKTAQSACIVILSLLCGTTSPEDTDHTLLTPGDLAWGPASPKLPPGAQLAVLLGDPSVPDELYVFRVKLPDGYSVPPHWHPMDEHVTVLKGLFAVGFGERMDRAALRELPPGSYVRLPREEPHYNLMKGETVLQFHGIGPYDIVYVDPDDDPSRQVAGAD